MVRSSIRMDVSHLTSLAPFSDTTPKGIAGDLARLVTNGDLEAGRTPAHGARARHRAGREPGHRQPGLAGTRPRRPDRVTRACGQLRARGIRRSSRAAHARHGGTRRPRAPRPLARHPRPPAAARARAGALARLGARRDRQLPVGAGDPRARDRARRLVAIGRRAHHGRRRRARRALAHARAGRAVRRPGRGGASRDSRRSSTCSTCSAPSRCPSRSTSRA